MICSFVGDSFFRMSMFPCYLTFTFTCWYLCPSLLWLYVLLSQHCSYCNLFHISKLSKEKPLHNSYIIAVSQTTMCELSWSKSYPFKFLSRIFWCSTGNCAAFVFCVMADIQELLMTRSVLALVNGQPWDMHKPLSQDCELRFLHFKDDDPSLSNQVCFVDFVVEELLHCVSKKGPRHYRL